MRTVAAAWFLMATIFFGTEVAKPGGQWWQAFLAGVCAWLTVQFTVWATRHEIRHEIRDERRRKWRELLDDRTGGE